MTRHITDNGMALIRRFEGYRAKSYRDSAGFPTIGYGHLIKPGETFDAIDLHQAVEMLRKDVEGAERSVLRLINVPLADDQFDALVSFTFNLGGGSLQRSTLRKKVNREEHDAAPSEFLKWCRVGGKWNRGLARRRGEEAVLYSKALPWA